MVEDVKFAVIGCGRVATQHVEAIERIKGARLVALCDLKEERAGNFAEPRSLPVYTNYHKMLAVEDVDVVNIVTPSGMHYDHAMDIMRRYRKSIVVEKPMALRVEHAEEMIRTARDLGVQIHVVMQNRFNKAVQKIRQAVDADLFGKFVLGTVRLRWCRPQSYYDRDPWRGTWGFDGGALTNQTIHHIDLLQWLCGDVEEVYARAATCLVDVEVEDTAVVCLKFKHGGLGAIEATTGARPDDFEASLSLLGENGTVIAEGASVNQIKVWTFGEIDTSEFSETPPNVYGFGHVPLLENVAASIRGEAEPLIGGEEGIKSVKLLHAIYASIESGISVKLADNPVSSRLGIIPDKDEWIRRIYLTPAEGE